MHGVGGTALELQQLAARVVEVFVSVVFDQVPVFVLVVVGCVSVYRLALPQAVVVVGIDRHQPIVGDPVDLGKLVLGVVGIPKGPVGGQVPVVVVGEAFKLSIRYLNLLSSASNMMNTGFLPCPFQIIFCETSSLINTCLFSILIYLCHRDRPLDNYTHVVTPEPSPLSLLKKCAYYGWGQCPLL